MDQQGKSLIITWGYNAYTHLHSYYTFLIASQTDVKNPIQCSVGWVTLRRRGFICLHILTLFNIFDVWKVTSQQFQSRMRFRDKVRRCPLSMCLGTSLVLCVCCEDSEKFLTSEMTEETMGTWSVPISSMGRKHKGKRFKNHLRRFWFLPKFGTSKSEVIIS